MLYLDLGSSRSVYGLSGRACAESEGCDMGMNGI